MVPPQPLTDGAMEALAALEAYTQTSLTDLSEWHRGLFREYADELREYFRRYSQPGRRLDPDTPPPDVWSVTAPLDRVPAVLADSFTELSQGLCEVDEDAIEEWLDDAMVEGHQRELWLLAMSGIDITPYTASLPEDEEDRHGLLLTLGVLGASWLARRRGWRDDVTQRVTQWTRASILGGATLDETLTGYERLTDGFTSHVKALVQNEMVRAHDIGMDLGLTAARRDHSIPEVWVTRADRLVCPVCAPRHMTVTPLQPITDSHPACRCRKVPVPENYRFTDVDYEDLFETAFGGQ